MHHLEQNHVTRTTAEHRCEVPIQADDPGGTLVTYGTATAVVVATGGRTELGRISTMLSEATDLQTPLTKALESIGKLITGAMLTVSLAMVVVGVVRMMGEGVEVGLALKDTLIFAVALAVGAIPEGLPAIVTIALAIGVQLLDTKAGFGLCHRGHGVVRKRDGARANHRDVESVPSDPSQ